MELQARVESTQLSEKQYRGLKDRLSYSSIKLFDNDRKRFFHEAILGEPKKETESASTLMGSLVHCLLAGQPFDEKFHMISVVEPKGQLKELVDALFRRTLKSMVDGVVTEKFEILFTDAVQEVKYDVTGKEVAFKGKDLDKIVGMFEGDAEIYYKELLQTIGKSVVTVNLVTKAEQIVQKLQGHSYTYEYANARSAQGIDVFNELTILFEIDGVPYKSMLDKVIVNHDAKTIELLDWKTSWDNEEPQRAYLKFGYYLQAPLYDYALSQWAKEHGLENYTIVPMKYIFCDTSGFADPVVLALSQDDLIAGWNGFKLRGYEYRGLKELMSDIAWHVDTGNWATSKAIYEANGHLQLALDYEQK